MIFGLAAIFSISNISLAQTTGAAASSSSNLSSSSSKKATALVCVQTAVDNRENDLIGARTTQGNAIVTAYEVRKSSLRDAWSVADKIARKKAIKAALKNFNDSMRKISGDWKIARNAAWSKFKKDSKVCGGKISASEEDGDERNDQQ